MWTVDYYKTEHSNDHFYTFSTRKRDRKICIDYNRLEIRREKRRRRRNGGNWEGKKVEKNQEKLERGRKWWEKGSKDRVRGTRQGEL